MSKQVEYQCETGPGSSEELPVPFQESPPGFSFTAFAVRLKIVNPELVQESGSSGANVAASWRWWDEAPVTGCDRCW